MIDEQNSVSNQEAQYWKQLGSHARRTYEEASADRNLGPEIKLIRMRIAHELNGDGEKAPNHIGLVRLLTALCRVISQESKQSSEPSSNDPWHEAAEEVLQRSAAGPAGGADAG